MSLGSALQVFGSDRPAPNVGLRQTLFPSRSWIRLSNGLATVTPPGLRIASAVSTASTRLPSCNTVVPTGLKSYSRSHWLCVALAKTM